MIKSADNLTDRQLKLSYWYITNKLLLRKWLKIFLIVLSVIFWLFVLWQLIFLAINYSQEDYQTRRLIFGGNPNLLPLDSLKPAPLQTSVVQALGNESNGYDFFVQVANNNKDWLSTFDYQFVAPDGGGQLKSGFVLPGETKYLMALGVKSSAVQFQLANQKWRRVSDISGLYGDRYNFLIENDKFVAGQAVGDPGKLTFELTNKSAFSYWEVGITAVLSNGGNIVSVNYLTLNQVKSGEKRLVELLWNNPLPRVDSFEIVPEVNIFDDNNIMPVDSL
ncbi:MAG: hypothetical protein WC518_01685 [Patescibacteria group bacterium]